MRPHVRSRQLNGAQPHLASLLMGAVLLRMPAYASPPTRCEDSPACTELANKARSLSSAGKSEDAMKLYQAAYQVRPDPRLLYNTGRILHHTGRPGEAASYYKRVLDSGIDEGDLRQKVTGYLVQAQEESAQASQVPSTAGDSFIQPSSAKPAEPAYKRPWFWAVIGVASAVVVGGVVTGVVIGTMPKPPTDIYRPFE